MTDSPEYENIYEKIVARAWRDPEFKARLIADPRAAAGEMGLDWGDNVTITVVEDTAEEKHLLIPFSPAGLVELTDDELSGVAGGLRLCTFGPPPAYSDHTCGLP